MKINLAPIIAGVLLLAYLVGSTIFGIQMYKAYSRVENNQSILLDRINDINKDKQLVLTPSEFKQRLDSSTQVMMKQLDIKTKNLEQVVKATATGKATVVTVPRDTFIIRNDTILPATAFTYFDKYLTLKGIQTKDSVEVTWGSKDTLTLLLYWRREGRFIPKLFGRKAYRAAIQGENPYMEYIINENVKLKKE